MSNTDYYSPTCLCPGSPPVNLETKKQLCQVMTPLITTYCAPSKNPTECENMSKVRCMNSYNAQDLYNFMNVVATTTMDCKPPCVCNFWSDQSDQYR